MIAMTRAPGYAPSAPTEYGSLIRSRWRHSGRRGVLFAHMFGASSSIVYDPLYGPPAHEIAKAGMVAFAGDFAGNNNWGNDAASARMDDGFDYLVAHGAADDLVALASYSMGTYTVLNWAQANLDKLSSLALMLPGPGLEMIHDAFPTSLAPSIETAYGGAGGYASALATHDYVNFISDFEGIPIRLYCDLNDPFYVGLPESGGTDFPDHYSYITDAVSTAEIVTFNGGGHTLDNLDPRLPAKFLWEQL